MKFGSSDYHHNAIWGGIGFIWIQPLPPEDSVLILEMNPCWHVLEIELLSWRFEWVLKISLSVDVISAVDSCHKRSDWFPSSDSALNY